MSSFYLNTRYVYIFSDFCQVALPTGTQVIVKVGRGKTSSFMNVWIQASAPDFNNTKGKNYICTNEPWLLLPTTLGGNQKTFQMAA